MSGIISYGTYLPYFRLQRSQISATLGTPPGKGTRSVASFDEDPTSMGVEAARAALAATPDEVSARALYFATTRPPYLDKANATVIHAALGLHQDVFAADMVGSIRSGVGALCAAMQAAEPTLAVLSDIRTGLPGGADERDGGDGAVALWCAASGDFIAEYLGGASATTEVLDRWRNPGDLAARVWEERFGESVYGPLASAAFADALAKVSITPGDIDHLIVTGSHTRSIRRIAKSTGAPSTALVDDLAAVVGNTGTDHPALLLASVLDRAGPGEVIAVVVIADGVDVLVFRTTARLAERRQRVSVNQQLAVTSEDLTVAKFHTWRGVYRLEPPRRPASAMDVEVGLFRLAGRFVAGQPPRGDAGHIGQQQVGVPHVERNRHEELVFHHRPAVRARRRQQRRRVGHRDALPHLACLQLEVDRSGLGNFQPETVHARFLEARRRGRQVIDARRHRRQHIQPLHVARRLHFHAGVAVQQLNLRSRHQGPTGIGDAAGNHRILRPSGRGE